MVCECTAEQVATDIASGSAFALEANHAGGEPIHPRCRQPCEGCIEAGEVSRTTLHVEQPERGANLPTVGPERGDLMTQPSSFHNRRTIVCCPCSLQCRLRGFCPVTGGEANHCPSTKRRGVLGTAEAYCPVRG